MCRHVTIVNNRKANKICPSANSAKNSENQTRIVVQLIFPSTVKLSKRAQCCAANHTKATFSKAAVSLVFSISALQGHKPACLLSGLFKALISLW